MNGYNNFEFSIFLTVGDIIGMFSDDVRCKREFDYFKRHTRFTKVYLEYFRGSVIPLDTLLKAKAFFESQGIKTATAIMPVPGGRRSISAQIGRVTSDDLVTSQLPNTLDHTGKMLCFTSPEVIELFDKGLPQAGKHFDEFMIDDSLTTNCTCERCRRLKGERSWAEFRTEYMAEFCREHIIAPLKKANPNIKITLKFPTWSESFEEVGYSTRLQPSLFDEIYAGTETRHTTYSLFDNPRYTSYSLLRLLCELPEKNCRGGWFDSIQCGNNINVFCEQAEMTLLAAPKEITLFCWGGDYDTLYTPALGYTMEKLDRILDKLGTPQEIPVYTPHGSFGENHIYDYLGYCGFPLAPTVTFPSDSRTVLLTEASCHDTALTEKIKAHLSDGGDVFLTAGCLAKLKGTGIEDCTAMSVTGRKLSSSRFGGFDTGWSAGTRYYSSRREIIMPLIDRCVNESEYIAVQLADSVPNVLLGYSQYMNGRLYLLNTPDSFDGYYDIPEQVMDFIRKYMSSCVSARLEGQNGIMLFIRENGVYCLKSLLEHGSLCTLVIKGDIKQITDIYTGRALNPIRKTATETYFSVAIDALTMHIFSTERN